MLAGGLVGLVFGGLLTELALWAPFCSRPSGCRLAWPTVRLPIATREPSAKRRHRFASTVVQ